MRSRSCCACLVVLTTGFGVLHGAPGSASDIFVTTTADVEADDGLCSFREAATAANTDTASGALPGECPAGGLGTVLYGMQEEALLSCVEKHPQVPVEHRPVLAAAARSLIDASQDCGLVVLGSRGRSGVVGGLTGSVSGHVLRHAYCPVAVVRG